MTLRTTIVISLAVVSLSGCAHYQAQQVQALCGKNRQATAVGEQMCQDFLSASQNLSTGDDTAFPLIGKASEIKELSTQMQKHSVQCGEVVSRCRAGNEALPECTLANRALGSFKSSWEECFKLVGGN